MKSERAVHNIEPVYDRDSRILILGSFPSVKSREAAFFYHHPQNRFWKVLADVLDEEFPETVEERKAFLKRNHIALWDVLASCEIKGASDVSIRNAEPNDMNRILKAADIRAIFATGAKAAELYKKLCLPACGVEAIRLPSTSPANCGCSYEKLREAYSQICDYVR